MQLTASSFKILGKGNYMALDGDRDTGETNSAQRGQPLGAKTEFNDFKQVNLSYKNDETPSFHKGVFCVWPPNDDEHTIQVSVLDVDGGHTDAPWQEFTTPGALGTYLETGGCA